MGIGKWITGAIGWAFGGPLGGLVGYLLGSLFEGDQSGAQRVYTTGGGFSANEQRNNNRLSASPSNCRLGIPSSDHR